MAKYLERLGYRVTVLTTAAYGRCPDDDSDDRGVVRTADLRLIRACLRRADVIRGTYGADIYSLRPHPISYLAVPDRMIVAWAPFAVRAAFSLHRARPFDAVITTSPPESAHFIGWALAAKGCAWVADLRDGWMFEPVRPSFPTALQRRIDAWLERRVLQAADIVTCVSRPVVEDLRDRLDVNAVLTPNGFDPDLTATEGEEEAEVGALQDPDRV